MKSFEMKKMLKLTQFELLVQRGKMMGWAMAIFAIMFLYMILFPSIQDMAQMKLDAMPVELLQFVGMDDLADMSDYITYFGMIYNLILIAISVFAATFSANLLYKEEKTKSIEFLQSLEVSRSEVYFSKLLTAFVAILVVVSSAACSTLICGLINGGDTFVIMNFIQIVKVSSFTPFFFMAISFLLAGATASFSTSMVSSMIVLMCYVVGYLGVLLNDKAAWLLNLSPFEVFKPEAAVLLETQTIIALGIYSLIAVIFIAVGNLIYKKRDFK